MVAQETTVVTISTERDGLKVAVRTAEEAHQSARARLGEADKLTLTQAEKLQVWKANSIRRAPESRSVPMI